MEIGPYAPLNTFVDLLLDAICVVDRQGHFVFVSAACERIFGYTQQEMIGMRMIDLVAPDDRERTLAAANDIIAGHPRLNFENRYVRKDGHLVDIMWSARWLEADQVRIAIAHDITERKQSESAQAALFAISEAAHAAVDLFALFGQIHQIIGKLLSANNFSVALYDRKSELLSFPYHANEDHDSAAVPQAESRAFCAEVIRSRLPLLRNATVPDAASANPARVDNGAAQCWLGVPLDAQHGTIGALILCSDRGGMPYTEKHKALLHFISTQVAAAIERKQLQTRLQYMSQYDALTDLPNRGLLYDRLDVALARSQREQTRLALLYIDLDKFKQVNDTFGHAAGDLLLKEVASRLKECVRGADTVARMSGDEFVVLLENVQATEHAAMVAEKIRNAISQPILISGRSLRILPSIGVARYPENGESGQQLLTCADEAMYQEKRASEQAGAAHGDAAQLS